MSRIALSFDDGLLAQFKWARGLYRYEIPGTFYVNPFFIGFGNYLTLDQLKQMKDWGHTIANHLWLHEVPAKIGIDVILGNYYMAKKWLEKNGFEDGSALVALPYGSVGGKWTDEHIETMLDNCDQIRDVGLSCNSYGSKVISAVESTDLILVEDQLICHYFHGNHNTSDKNFVEFLDNIITSKIEISSMFQEAYNESLHAIS